MPFKRCAIVFHSFDNYLQLRRYLYIFVLANKNLNRAEAAVLLYKLKKSLGVVKEEYVASETVVGVEHLDVTKKAECDEVKITNERKIVLAKNIIKGYFYTEFSSKEAAVGDTVTFTAKNDIYTEEGTLIIPAATTMKAVITSIEEKKWWNKNDKVMVEFQTMTLPSGVTVPFSAEVLNNNGVLTENRWAKPLAYTVGGAAVGVSRPRPVFVNPVPPPPYYGPRPPYYFY
jgi:hypothetical protein